MSTMGTMAEAFPNSQQSSLQAEIVRQRGIHAWDQQGDLRQVGNTKHQISLL